MDTVVLLPPSLAVPGEHPSMNKNVVHTIRLIYQLLLHLYPADFRETFAEEMTAVFTEAIKEVSRTKPSNLLFLCLRELRDFPIALLREHWHNMNKNSIFQIKRQPARLLEILSGKVLVVLILTLLAMALPVAQIVYSEIKGPYRSITDVADLDGDGDLDVIVGHTRWESEDISWAGIDLWLNQGDGQFILSDWDLPGGFSGFSAAAGDLDGDGDTDLLILDGYKLTLSPNPINDQGGKLGIFPTNRSLIIRPSNIWRGHTDMGGSIVLGDLNKDGALDGFVAGCCYGSGENPRDPSAHIPSSAWVWINEWDANGRLVNHTLSLENLDGLPMRDVALGDIDGDGDLDIFAAVGSPTIGSSNSLADLILLNDGSGNFTPSGQKLGETDSFSVALGDLDNDGDLDALVGTGNGSVTWINQGGFQNGTEGTFVVSNLNISSGQTRELFLSDLDGDGDLDALIAGPRQAIIWWNNGQAIFTQSSQRFRYSERNGIAIGDFNGDGSPDIFAGGNAEAYSVWFNHGDGTFK